MSDNPIVIRAKHTGGLTKVRALITHPMVGHDDLRNKNNGEGRPHFIQEIICRIDEKTIMSALCSSYVAKDPFISFAFRGGNKGETIKLSWVDNWGEHGSTEVVID